jgi:hypothetical protein
MPTAPPVRQRTREIGLGTVTDARSRDIGAGFLIEAVTWPTVGGPPGITLGVCVAPGADALSASPADVRRVASTLAVAVSVTGLAARRRAASSIRRATRPGWRRSNGVERALYVTTG